MAPPVAATPPERPQEATSPPELSQGAQKKKRRQFSHLEKLGIIRNVRHKIEEEGMSQRAACDALNIHHTMFGSWLKCQATMKSSRNNKAKSLAPGRSSGLEPIKDRLLQWIFEKREQGMPISTNQVVIKAAERDQKLFGEVERSKIQQCSAIYPRSWLCLSSGNERVTAFAT